MQAALGQPDLPRERHVLRELRGDPGRAPPVERPQAARRDGEHGEQHGPAGQHALRQRGAQAGGPLRLVPGAGVVDLQGAMVAEVHGERPRRRPRAP
ncbi:MAG: hypothetical protein ACXWC6_12550, partial [Ramlibacter sp.]